MQVNKFYCDRCSQEVNHYGKLFIIAVEEIHKDEMTGSKPRMKQFGEYCVDCKELIKKYATGIGPRK